MQINFNIEQFLSLEGYEETRKDRRKNNKNGYYDINDFLEMNDKEILDMNEGKRFGLCLMNPPYNNALGDSFLNKVLDISNIVISIQPESYLFRGKNGNVKIKQKLNKGYTTIENIDPNLLFDAHFQSKLGIILHDSTKDDKILIDNKEIKTLDNLKRYFDDDLIVEFSNIINPLINKDNAFKKWFGTPGSHYKDRYVENEDKNCWVVQCVLLRGHVAPKQKDGKADDFYTMIPRNKKLINEQFIGQYKDLIQLKNNKNKLKLQYYFKFDSKQEANNFINYIKTDFARACLYLEKKDMNVYWQNIPWFDFSDEHFNKSPREIDNWLFKKYNINDEIRKHIEEILPDYYGIRK